MAKNQLLRTYNSISVFSASISFVVYSLFYNKLKIVIKNSADHDVNKDGIIDSFTFEVILGFVIAAVSYKLVFKLIMFVYTTIIWRYWTGSGFIGGSWEFFYDVYEPDAKIERALEENECSDPVSNKGGCKQCHIQEMINGRFQRYDIPGAAFISHTIEGVTITSQSHDQLNLTKASGAKSLWTTSSGALVNDIYNGSLSMSHQNGLGHGSMRLHVLPADDKSGILSILRRFGWLGPKPPQVILGHFTFAEAGYTTRGRIIFKRRK